MKQYAEAVISFTVIHPILVMALCLIIGFFMGIILTISIAKIGRQEEREAQAKSYEDMKNFFNPNNK
jgi:uncharacterized YccA/Bax inhibitor family protein